MLPPRVARVIEATVKPALTCIITERAKRGGGWNEGKFG